MESPIEAKKVTQMNFRVGVRTLSSNVQEKMMYSTRTTTTSAMDALDNFSLLKFSLWNSTNAVGSEVCVPVNLKGRRLALEQV